MKLLFKLTTRSRPQRAIKTLESIFNNVTTDNFHILISLDHDDLTTTAIYDWCDNKFDKITIASGTSKNKIDAINRDLNNFLVKWDVLLNVSDDQVFIKKGFDKIVIDALNGNLDQFLHFPDGNRNDLATMSIIGFNYYQRDKFVYHPSYQSVYCDNEAQEVAVIRGCYKFINDNILSHEHPAYSKGTYDSLYSKNDRFYNDDESNYIKRKKLNFEL